MPATQKMPATNNFTSHFIAVNHINIHYMHLANPGKPTLLLMHGLTANCRAFDGLINHGLAENFDIISVDLRGRGLSDKPLFGYSIKMHAHDMVELVRKLNLQNVTLVGHSYGGILASFLCFFYHHTFNKVVFLDSAPEMNKKTPEMLQTAFSRLDTVYDNKEAYFKKIKGAEYITIWDKDNEAYFEADIQALPDGKVEPRPNLAQIMQVAFDVGMSPLQKYFKHIKQPALLVCATENYTLNEPILPGYLAEKMVTSMHNCQLEYVEANHHTMLYDKHAAQIVKYINKFVLQG